MGAFLAGALAEAFFAHFAQNQSPSGTSVRPISSRKYSASQPSHRIAMASSISSTTSSTTFAAALPRVLPPVAVVLATLLFLVAVLRLLVIDSEASETGSCFSIFSGAVFGSPSAFGRKCCSGTIRAGHRALHSLAALGTRTLFLRRDSKSRW